MTEHHLDRDVYAWEVRVLNFKAEKLTQSLIESELALLDELHDAHRGETFAHRSDSEQGIVIYRLLCLILDA